MNRLTQCVCVLLVMALCCSLFAFQISAAEPEDMEDDFSQDIDIAAVGAGYHRDFSYDGLPFDDRDEQYRSVSRFMADASEITLSINGKHRMVLMDGSSNVVNARCTFSSSDSSVASVSDSGLIIGKRSGIADISAVDRLSGSASVCTVYVGSDYAPIEIPSELPSEPPTDPPPTEKPTEKPTEPPTEKPTEAPTQAPTEAPTQASETLSLNAYSATVYRGCCYHVVASSNASVSFSSSDNSIAAVDSKGIVTAKANGNVTITARTSTKSAACTITVKSGESVNISHTSATVDRFMTFLMTSSTSGVKWSSSDTSVATVDNGFVLGVKAGTAVITAYTSKGAATCLMTVDSSFPVRFAYASPNCAAKNQTVTLVAITDTMRTGVRFAVGSGSDLYYVNATSKVADGDTYVWKGTTSFSKAGTYSVKAYSQFNNGTSWHSCSDANTTAFVADSSDMTTTASIRRRASDDIINLIATFEGFSKSAYADVLTGHPTLGYGRVVYPGEEFYNDLTKAEAYAYLVQTVNNEGYADNVNSFLIDNNIRFNQQQFDALVCFVYNVGSGPLYNDEELIDALKDCKHGSVLDFDYINKQHLINKFCQYHHAGGCIYGLLYRRVDETEVFFYGDYNADYGNYRYPVSFTCASNSSFHT